jgi:hypothetical protein
MLKKSLIGLGIGLGVLAVCLMLLVAGGMVGGLMGYLGASYVVKEASPVPSPPEAPVPDQTLPETPEGW